MDEIEKLERWTASGAHWRVVYRTLDHVTIALITCTGGEVAEWVKSADEHLLGWLGARQSSDE
ncbi:MAG: hypothetical protein Q4F67_00500 [Propionibacteriaceae bacterium]|nr:hypothetical protein [Propionibacteriaceae bacterium]